MPNVPTTQATVNIHRNSRSNTIATYFQSSWIYKTGFYNYISQRRVISTATASLRHCRLSHCERTGCKYDSLKLKNAVSKTFCMANALNHRYILTVFKNVIRSYTNKNIFAIVLEKNNFVELVITKTLLDFDIHVLV